MGNEMDAGGDDVEQFVCAQVIIVILIVILIVIIIVILRAWTSCSQTTVGV